MFKQFYGHVGKNRGKKLLPKKKIHKDAKKVFLGPEFNLIGKYAESLAVVWTCMTWSSALPFMYPLGFLLLWTTYLSEKYALIHHNSKMLA